MSFRVVEEEGNHASSTALEHEVVTITARGLNHNRCISARMVVVYSVEEVTFTHPAQRGYCSRSDKPTRSSDDETSGRTDLPTWIGLRRCYPTLQQTTSADNTMGKSYTRCGMTMLP
jgi:hypothetical protein